MAIRVLVLHGPNINLLGSRGGGEVSYEALNVALAEHARALSLELEVVQSNHEGALIDALHAARTRVQAVVVSPAGLFGSYPLREALEATGLPAVEVYLRPLEGRTSVLAPACRAQVAGKGIQS